MINQTMIDAHRESVISPRKLLINGKFESSSHGEEIEIFSPIDGRQLTTVQSGSAEDVDRAVSAARKAFESGCWSRAAPAERKAKLLKLATLIEENALELTVTGVRDNGTEFNMAIKAEAGSAAANFRYYAEAIDKVYGEVASTSHAQLGLVLREAIGVVGAIIPWNMPLMIGTWKIAPALAAGNSVVLKPAEIASLSMLRLAELALEAGIPAGVLNVVTGKGSVTGEALGLHNDVDVLAFTGSAQVGKRLLEYSARSNLKRVYLELGGKSPNIVFADAPDLDAAVRGSVNGMFRNSGQICISGTRLLLERSIHDEFVDKMVNEASALKIGDPLDLSSDVGAISSATQLNDNLRYVQTALDEGAELRTGGARIHEESGGYYMQPTIFTQVDPQASIAQEEIFGPVLSVMAFDDYDQAVRIANNTEYGLAAGVWTSNLKTAHSMIRDIRSGLVHVNCYGGSSLAVPLGGVKQSGNGHDKSLHAFDKFTDLKSAWISL